MKKNLAAFIGEGHDGDTIRGDIDVTKKKRESS